MKFAAYSFTMLDIIFVIGALFTFGSTEDTFFSNPTFVCANGNHIKVTQHNDGVNDCGDFSDEYDDPLVVTIGCNQNRSRYYNAIEGYFMNSKEKFISSISICEYPRLLIPLEMYQTYIFFMCEGQYDQIYRMDREGQNMETISLPGKRIQAMAIDQITSNVYIVESGRIQMCDINFIACFTFPGKKAINVAFSSQTGALYWVYKESDQEWRTVTSRRDGSGERVILRSRAPIEFITVDQSTHDLYWLLLKPRKIIYSYNYTTRVREPWVANNFSVDNVDAFAVNGPLNIILIAKSEACVIDDDLSTAAVHNSLIGRNIVLYTGLQSITPEKLQEKKACAGMRCSHLCTYVSETEYTCFCDDSSGLEGVNPHNGFCEGSTLVVARRVENKRTQPILPPPIRRMTQFSSNIENGNELWLYDGKVVDGVQTFSKLGQLSFQSVTSFSELTYDSVQGRLIFTVTGLEEGIYAYTLGQADPRLLVPVKGSIIALEFDDWGNNIYYIPSSGRSINIASCATGETVTIIPAEPSFFPRGLAVFPEMGWMFVLVQKTSHIALQRYTMYGERRKVLKYFDILDGTPLSLHGIRNKGILLFLPPIRYYEITRNDFNTFPLLENSTIWRKTDLWSRAFASAEKTGELFLFKFAVATQAVESNRSECRTANGGCQGVCLIVPTPLNITCSEDRSPIIESISEEIIEEGSGSDEEKTESNHQSTNASDDSNPGYLPKEHDTVHGSTVSLLVSLLLLSASLLLIAVIILLITLIILCRSAVSRRKNRAKRESVQLKSLQFNRINYNN